MSAIHNISTNDYIPELSKTSSIIAYELYIIDGYKELTLEEYLNEISLRLSNLINKKKKEEYNFKIQLSVGVNFIHDIPEVCIFHIRSDAKKFNKSSDATKITKKFIESFFKNYHDFLSDNPMFAFNTIYESGVHVNIINYKCHCNHLE